MASLHVTHIPVLTSSREFLLAYNVWMKETLNPPDRIGINTFGFRLLVSEEGGFDLFMDTNRKMNMGATDLIKQLTKGFIGGYLARE